MIIITIIVVTGGRGNMTGRAAGQVMSLMTDIAVV
jgi:hypothetical protein